MIGHSPRQLAGCTRLITLDQHGRVVRDERVDPSELPTIATTASSNGNGNGNGGGRGRGDGLL